MVHADSTLRHRIKGTGILGKSCHSCRLAHLASSFDQPRGLSCRAHPGVASVGAATTAGGLLGCRVAPGVAAGLGGAEALLLARLLGWTQG